ncbi:ankyrin repeat and SOCS box protein 15-like isoform X2 [Anguilla anguilla]|uniref:ankyrin repeat and SOCS box protein 15-like isoform X2 n=1 Tax=Anguilla anguilla TaxID=7936 RepID=UPI0015B22CC0|nr:ankyrin repeat and SOCS box protein 15-like isoform X2 [Anguilla anguilla]
MDSFAGLDEDQLIDYVIQMSIQESCKQNVLTAMGSLETASDENIKVLAAIERGDTAVLQRLSEFTSAFGEVDSRGWLPLHRAAVHPVVQVLETVVHASYKLSLEEKTPEGETALTLAIKAGLVENARLLLSNWASPHTTNSKNESPLLLAVKMGSYDAVASLIMHGAVVDQNCLKKWTAVHEAAKVGCSDVMMLLLRNGGSVTERDQHGVTPLGIAAEYAHADVLELLINYGGDVNAQAPNGDSVLYDAAGSGNPDCIDLLLEHGANPNVASLSSLLPMHRAAQEGHLLALRMLIPITTRRAIRLCGQSPVHSAAEGGHPQCLELLLENGFEVNAVLNKHISENYGDLRKSPLYFAVCNGDTTCTEILLNAGAKPDVDPLHCLLVAIRAGRYEIVKLLLARQADVNCYFTVVTDTVFPTALQYCLRDEMMMRLLLNNGYDAERCFCCHHDNRFRMMCSWNDLNNQLCEGSTQEKIPLVLHEALVRKCGADPSGLCQPRAHLLQTQTHSGEAERVA